MTHTDMLQQVAKPFHPFRLTTASGDTYEVRHREGFILTPTYITVGLLAGLDGTSFERTVILDLFHVVSVEPLPAVGAVKGKGQASQ